LHVLTAAADAKTALLALYAFQVAASLRDSLSHKVPACRVITIGRDDIPGNVLAW
jgi:hypothetical protein